MKIIDAHLHFRCGDGFDATAAASGHFNTPEHLLAEMNRLGICVAIAMGTGRREAGGDELPGLPDFPAGELGEKLYYCAGVNGEEESGERPSPSLLEAFERQFRDPHCVGIKIYLGYRKRYAADGYYRPFYELAGQYGLPVVFHTGDTAGGHGLIKYAHPLTIDEVAADFPETRFVMAHYGNPWIVDATEVAAKNDNVFIDLSGLAVGNFDPEWFVKHYHGYVEHLRSWITYLSDYGKFLYGTDWPLTNLEAYGALMRRLIPEEHHAEVFFGNACRVFSRLKMDK